MQSKKSDAFSWFALGLLGLGLGLGAFLLFDQPAPQTSTWTEAPAPSPSPPPTAPAEPEAEEPVAETDEPIKEEAPASDAAGQRAVPSPSKPITALPAVAMKEVEIRPLGGTPVHRFKASVAVMIRLEKYHDSSWGAPLEDSARQRRIKEILEANGFAVREVINPSGEELKQQLRNLPREFAEQDRDGLRVLVLFSGHARTLRDTTGEPLTYLAPVDAPKPSADDTGHFRTLAVSLAEIQTAAESLPAHHALFIVNAPAECPFLDPDLQEARPVADSAAARARQVIVASPADGENSWSIEHVSQFHERLIHALGGPADVNRDGLITGAELGRALDSSATPAGQGVNFVNPYFGYLKSTGSRAGEFMLESLTARNLPAMAADAPLEKLTPLPASATVELPPGPAPELAGKSFSTAEGLRMIWVAPGSYSLVATADHPLAGGAQSVSLPGYWISEGEVTRVQFEKVMIEGPPAPAGVVSMDASYDQATAFCQRLTALSGSALPTGHTFRLPTEEEWERVAVQGDTAYRIQGGGMRSPASSGRVESSASGFTPLGLRDLIGSLREWCVAVAPSANATDAASATPAAIPSMLVRGDTASHKSNLENVSTRFTHYEAARNYEEVGFRVVLAPSPAAGPLTLASTSVTSGSTGPAARDMYQTAQQGPTSAGVVPPQTPPVGPVVDPKDVSEVFQGSRCAAFNLYSRKGILRKAQAELGNRKKADGSPYYAGKPDGGVGPMTVEAVKAFQSDPANRLIVTARLDDATLAALNLAEEKEQAAPSGGVPRPPPMSKYDKVGGSILLAKDKLLKRLDKEPQKSEYRRHLRFVAWDDRYGDAYDEANGDKWRR